MEAAAESQSYCDDYRASLRAHGLGVSEVSTHLQGQLVAVHPAYDALFYGGADPSVRGDPVARSVAGRGRRRARTAGRACRQYEQRLAVIGPA